MDKYHLKTLHLGLLFIAMGFGAWGCQSPPNGLKLGSLLPITGDLASYGASMQNSARLLVKTANACGGVGDRPITLIDEDDQTDPTIGATAMTKLTEVDQVTAVIGAASSAVSSAAVPIAVRNQVVQISPSSTSPIFTARSRKGEFDGFWFRTAPPDNFQGKALAQLAHQRGFRRVAILAINNDYGQGLIDAFMPAFKTLGGQVAKPTLFDPKANTFDSEIQQAMATQPDAVLLIAYPETGSLILKSAYEAGSLSPSMPWIATDGLKDIKLAKLVGKNAKNQFIAAGLQGTAAHPSGLGFKAFRDRFFKAYSAEPTIYDPNTWDATALVVLAAEAAKAFTGTAIREQVRAIANPPGTEVTDICQALDLLRQGQEINYQGASSNVDLNADGDVAGSYDIWEIQPNGAFKAISTLNIQK